MWIHAFWSFSLLLQLSNTLVNRSMLWIASDSCLVIKSVLSSQPPRDTDEIREISDKTLIDGHRMWQSDTLQTIKHISSRPKKRVWLLRNVSRSPQTLTVRAGSCLKKNIVEKRVEPTSITKVPIESWATSKRFLPDLKLYYTQLWRVFGVHRSTPRCWSQAPLESPT